MQTHLSCCASFASGVATSVQGADWQPGTVKSQTSACVMQMGPCPSALVMLHYRLNLACISLA